MAKKVFLCVLALILSLSLPLFACMADEAFTKDDAAVPADRRMDTACFFNPQGGRHYHADSLCASVSDTYLPLSPIPEAGDDAALYDALTPCPFCIKTDARFFNPQGGRHYHADARCTSVADAYLPLSPIPETDEDAALYDALTPCPHCIQE